MCMFKFPYVKSLKNIFYRIQKNTVEYLYSDKFVS